jgi:hypothetical protein
VSDVQYPQQANKIGEGEYRTSASLAERELMLPLACELRWCHSLCRVVGALLLLVRCPKLAPLSARARELLLSRKSTSRSLFDDSCNTHVEPCLLKLALSCLVRVSLLPSLRGLLGLHLAFAEQIVGKLITEMLADTFWSLVDASYLRVWTTRTELSFSLKPLLVVTRFLKSLTGYEMSRDLLPSTT